MQPAHSEMPQETSERTGKRQRASEEDWKHIEGAKTPGRRVAWRQKAQVVKFKNGGKQL